MRAALVTGGGGFIGSHVASALLNRGVNVTVLDNFETGRREAIPAGVRVVEDDLTNSSAVDRAVSGAEVVFHLAAFVSVPESFERPERCLSVNVTGLQHLLESAVRHGVRKIVFSSSSAVYADEPAIPKCESELPGPTSPYGATKLHGEHLLALYERVYGLAWVALRYFNVFGPGQTPESEYAAVIPAFLDRALRGVDLTIYGDGSQTRDFIYVDDVVAANVQAVAHGQGIYNIGMGQAYSILHLAEAVIRLGGGTNRLNFAPVRRGDARCSVADNSLARRELDWTPRWLLSEGLGETMGWFRRRVAVR